MYCAAVAQLDRVLGYEPRGRGFDSCQPHHYGRVNLKRLTRFHLANRFSLDRFRCGLKPQAHSHSGLLVLSEVDLAVRCHPQEQVFVIDSDSQRVAMDQRLLF
jgi:hypothetical protein